MLAFFVNLLVVSNYTPEAAADLPIIGVYYTFNIIQVALSVGASVCVLRFHFRGHKPNKLPNLIKKLLFMNSLKEENLNQDKKEEKFQLKNGHINNNNIINKNELDNKDEKIKKNTIITKTPNNTVESNSLLNDSILTLVKLVEKTNKLMKKEKKNLIASEINKIEWKEAARRMDNVLYLISVSIVTITPIYLFIGYFLNDFDIKFCEKCKCSE